MKKLFMLGLFATVSLNASAIDKVIYGEDDRRDVYEETNSLYLDLAASTAGMIPNSKIVTTDSNEVTFRTSTLSSRGICEDEKFANQQTAANCSGFLVAPDLLVTAGHCIRTQNDCESNKWVFGYSHNSTNTDQDIKVSKNDVYGCSEIIERSLEGGAGDDYALIRLERKVEDRTPLNFRTSGKVEDNTPIVVIGHPSGLPTKIADGANVRSNSNSTYFQANLDTFGGNSGSAVFNAETGVVEGILVRGETDYTYDWDRGCRVVYSCSDAGCRGEDVTRITNIKALQNL